MPKVAVKDALGNYKNVTEQVNKEDEPRRSALVAQKRLAQGRDDEAPSSKKGKAESSQPKRVSSAFTTPTVRRTKEQKVPFIRRGGFRGRGNAQSGFKPMPMGIKLCLDKGVIGKIEWGGRRYQIVFNDKASAFKAQAAFDEFRDRASTGAYADNVVGSWFIEPGMQPYEQAAMSIYGTGEIYFAWDNQYGDTVVYDRRTPHVTKRTHRVIDEVVDEDVSSEVALESQPDEYVDDDTLIEDLVSIDDEDEQA